MSQVENLVKSSEKLTVFFGCWPSFHDAEVVDVHYWRGAVQPGDWHDSNIFPVLTVKLRILRATQKDYSSNSPDVLATLRFYDVDHFMMDGFNHVNQIFDFTVESQERGTFPNGEKWPPEFVISFVRGFGMSASFHCFHIEVLDAVPYRDQTDDASSSKSSVSN